MGVASGSVLVICMGRSVADEGFDGDRHMCSGEGLLLSQASRKGEGGCTWRGYGTRFYNNGW